MLRKFLDYQLALTDKGKPLHFLRPLISAGDTFLYEAPENTSRAPHVRDAIDVKRWMFLVVIALIPVILVAIWNTGIQGFVYSSGDYHLMDEYLASKQSLASYFEFAFKDNRPFSILKVGLAALLPIVLISYLVGGLTEAFFACYRGHEISEGFLVTGILYALVLPPTIPYWMTAVGVLVGVVLSKEVFGGSGMNIVNPALACRAFLFFTFPNRMSGDVWVGTNPTIVRESLVKMNREANTSALDGYTQATPLAQFNISHDIKRIHIDALASNNLGNNLTSSPALERQFEKWNTLGNHQAALGALEPEQMKAFVTSPLGEGGLGLSPGSYEDAYRFSSLNYGLGENHDWSFFLGDKLGSMGETSFLAILLGALFLIYTGIGSWRTMVGMSLGAYLSALAFQWGSTLLGTEGGAWAPAQFGFPAYKHLLLGGLAFGIVFMATDPVSSPALKSARWIYGIFCGVVTIVIRVINPAYPEGVMLAILMGNVFAPLFDYYAARAMRRNREVKYVQRTS